LNFFQAASEDKGVAQDRMAGWVRQLVFVALGFVATTAQIVLLRELIVVFSGNELSLGILLASWLVWTSAGSGLLGKLRWGSAQPRLLVGGLLLAAAIALPWSIFLVRSSPSYFRVLPGELLGPGPMLLTSLVALAAFCLPSGWLFAAASRWCWQADRSLARATGQVYLFEALGSGVGGVLASLVLVPRFAPFQIAWLLSGLYVLLAVILLVDLRWPAKAPVVWIIVAGLLLAGWPVAQRWEQSSLRRLWRGFTVLASRNSPYGQLVVVDLDGFRSLYESGVRVASSAAPEEAEEAVHYALLEHPWPRRVLLIGGGISGAAAEVLKHPSVEHLDYVELDPMVLRLASEFFANEWQPVARAPRVQVHHLDGRLFLRQASHRFDVIIVNLPEPRTAQLNRFYTVEFFREAARKLAPGGVFSIRVGASENYISDELAELLRSLNLSLRAAFAEVAAIPGPYVHFFASNSRGVLTIDAGELARRIAQRRLETLYVREYYLPFRLTPDRLAMLREKSEPDTSTRWNRDFEPVAYYFGVALWSAQFHGWARDLFLRLAAVRFPTFLAGLAGAIVVAGGWFAWRAGCKRAAAGCAVGAMGLTMMALEVMLLLGFQAVYGYVYQQLALMIALFMVGLATGSWRSLERLERIQESAEGREFRFLACLAMIAALAGVVLYSLLGPLSGLEHPVALAFAAHVLFPALAWLAGLLGGYQFPLASHLYFAHTKPGGAGAVYALDLLGACVGALVLGTLLIPIYGFLRTALALFLLNLLVAVGVYWASFRGQTVAGSGAFPDPAR